MELWRLLKALTADYNLVHELDYFLIGTSLTTLPQLAEFCEAIKSDALKALSSQVIPLVEAKVSQLNSSHQFSFITLLNILNSHIPQNSPLLPLSKIYSLKPQKVDKVPTKSLLRYFHWLLHAQDLSDFLYKIVRSNYLLSEYGEKSTLIIGEWLGKVDIAK